MEKVIVFIKNLNKRKVTLTVAAVAVVAGLTVAARKTPQTGELSASVTGWQHLYMVHRSY